MNTATSYNQQNHQYDAIVTAISMLVEHDVSFLSVEEELKNHKKRLFLSIVGGELKRSSGQLFLSTKEHLEYLRNISSITSKIQSRTGILLMRSLLTTNDPMKVDALIEELRRLEESTRFFDSINELSLEGGIGGYLNALILRSKVTIMAIKILHKGAQL